MNKYHSFLLRRNATKDIVLNRKWLLYYTWICSRIIFIHILQYNHINGNSMFSTFSNGHRFRQFIVRLTKKWMFQVHCIAKHFLLTVQTIHIKIEMKFQWNGWVCKNCKYHLVIENVKYCIHMDEWQCNIMTIIEWNWNLQHYHIIHSSIEYQVLNWF